MEESGHRSIIITGASGGMGRVACAQLAAEGYNVVMACRNLEKAARIRQEILEKLPEASLEIEELHLDSLKSVREFAAWMSGRKFDALFNNAGTLPRRYSTSADGFEYTLAVNYLGPWLLTGLLLPSMKPKANIVNMISVSCYAGTVDRNFFRKGEKDFHQIRTYANTKLALLYFSIMLADRCGLKVNVADPGIVDTDMIRLERWFDPLTDIFFRPFCNSPKRGVRPAVNALHADSTKRLFSGNSSKPVPGRFLDRREDIEWLWNETENIVRNL